MLAGATRARLSWRDAVGDEQQALIGDNRPLVMAGYRIGTSSNKGFAPTFTWIPQQGEPRTGAVHLPSYPANEYNQASTWRLPGVPHELWVQLAIADDFLSPDEAFQFHTPNTGEHSLILRIDEQRYELKPGDSVELEGGRLIYTTLGSWMGFSVFSDWTLPWLLAACFLAVMCLGVYF